jgi:hypothetical protein
MMHGLVGLLVVVLGSGCAASMTTRVERYSGAGGQSASVVGMSPLIRTARGLGVVVGLTVPFDIGGHSSADEVSLEVSGVSRMIGAVTGKSPAQVEATKSSQKAKRAAY